MDLDSPAYSHYSGRMRPKGELANTMIMLIAVVVPFLGLLLGVYLAWNRILFASDILLFLVMMLVTGLGVTIGYHRMLTHQGFEAPSWLRAFFLILGCMALAGSKPDEWAATHIRHHAHSDEEGDPHSPLEGFWHAHAGWLFSLKNFSNADEYAPQLLQDRVVMFVSRTSTLWMILSFLIPFLAGGWTGLLWGGVVRFFWTTHTTWSVNSICHTFGNRAFDTNDESRNEWVIGLIALGEGWHNNHHAFPKNAFHGMRWWQFDLSGLLIRGLETVGLVWNVQRVAPEAEIAQQSRLQSMRHGIGDMRQNVLSSLEAMRKEIAGLGNRMLPKEPLTDAQWQQTLAFQQEAIRRLDVMREAVARSQNLKRQKMLHYQREAQKMMQECRNRWDRLRGVPIAA